MRNGLSHRGILGVGVVTVCSLPLGLAACGDVVQCDEHRDNLVSQWQARDARSCGVPGPGRLELKFQMCGGGSPSECTYEVRGNQLQVDALWTECEETGDHFAGCGDIDVVCRGPQLAPGEYWIGEPALGESKALTIGGDAADGCAFRCDDSSGICRE
ncbi:MAG: hypothetical protein R3B13_11720 [Polyangiaceae bacterium]